MQSDGGRKKYHSSTYSNIMKKMNEWMNEGVQKKSCLHQITQQPSPLSCLKIKMVGA